MSPPRFNGRTALVASCVTFILAMCAAVPWLTRELGAARGMLVVCAVYWLLFCLPLSVAFQGLRGLQSNLSLRVGSARWVPAAVFAQVCVVGLANLMLLPENVPSNVILLAVVLGCANGFSEEVFWRGSFLTQGRGNFEFQVIGVLLFTLWHVPLAFAQGVHYEGGPTALLAGALVLGSFWAMIVHRTACIGWPVVAHVLTNIIAFIGLINANFAR